MPLYSLARGFLAVEGDLEATFEIRDPDALRALAEAASGYEKYDPCGDCASEYRDLMSDEDVAKSSYAIGFAAGVDVALGLADRITDGEGE